MTHKNCGGLVNSELAYSDSDNDYYFPYCTKCQVGVELSDIEYVKMIDQPKIPERAYDIERLRPEE